MSIYYLLYGKITIEIPCPIAVCVCVSDAINIILWY